jgi:hypothetical protein
VMASADGHGMSEVPGAITTAPPQCTMLLSKMCHYIAQSIPIASTQTRWSAVSVMNTRGCGTAQGTGSAPRREGSAHHGRPASTPGQRRSRPLPSGRCAAARRRAPSRPPGLPDGA